MKMAPWSDKEVSLMVDLLRVKTPIDLIARCVGRSSKAVMNKKKRINYYESESEEEDEWEAEVEVVEEPRADVLPQYFVIGYTLGLIACLGTFRFIGLIQDNWGIVSNHTIEL